MDENAITKKILKKRTEQLARSKQDVQTILQEGLELVVFALGSESYALEAKALKSIVTVREIVHLPGVAPFIKGITNLSGVLYTVVDLKTLLGLKDTPDSDKPSLLILEHEKLKVCFLIDRIIAFKTIADSDLDGDITGIKSLETGLIKGLTSDALIVLNSQKILDKIAKESKRYTEKG